MVRTANDDKAVTAAVHLKLSVTHPAVVYVCYDKRATSLPSWLNDGTWTHTSEGVTVTDSAASPMRVYSKSVGAGQMTLGGNKAGGGTGAQSNYFVVVRPSVAAELWKAVLPDGMLDPGVWMHEGDSDGDGLRDEFEEAHGLDPRLVDTDGDGEVDETETAPDGLTFWEAQLGQEPSPEGGDGGDRGCGAVGLEALCLLLLASVWNRTAAGDRSF